MRDQCHEFNLGSDEALPSNKKANGKPFAFSSSGRDAAGEMSGDNEKIFHSGQFMIS